MQVKRSQMHQLHIDHHQRLRNTSHQSLNPTSSALKTHTNLPEHQQDNAKITDSVAGSVLSRETCCDFYNTINVK